MQKKNRATRMWLFGIVLVLVAGVAALPVGAAEAARPAWLGQPETLSYAVSYGFVSMGNARLDYVPSGPGGGRDGYTLTTWVQDNSALVDFRDTWTVQGRHGAAGVFLPDSYHAQQRENSYRADKRLDFARTASGGTVSFRNMLITAPPEVTPLTGPDMRDAFSALYALRAKGLDGLQQAQELTVMGTRKPFRLRVQPAVAERVEINGRKMEARRVTMMASDIAPVKGKIRTDTWQVWVLPDARLTPVKVEAKVALGTFRAVLQ